MGGDVGQPRMGPGASLLSPRKQAFPFWKLKYNCGEAQEAEL